MVKNKCPICGYEFNHCQCMYGESTRPDKDKQLDVVLKHLYLLHPEQINHIARLEKSMCIYYSDTELKSILKDLQQKHLNMGEMT